jgi:hypothetical protein
VFLANSTIGTSAGDSGVYTLQHIPSGKYQLVASSVGYVKKSLLVNVTEGVVHVDVELVPEVTQLKEVQLERENWEKHYKRFEKLFLGSTPNSVKCTITNPDVIFLQYDHDARVLKAEADVPIEVQNLALGYKIYYLLEEFQIDVKAGIVRIFGVPRFEYLQPTSERQARHWELQRLVAYNGSLRHFMRSLLTRTLKANKFHIYRSNEETEIRETELFADPETHRMNFKGEMRVIYDEFEDFAYRRVGGRNRSFQTSMLNFRDDAITIYDNGFFDRFTSLLLNGYMAWDEVMGDLVPVDYQPPRLKSK